MGLRLQEPCQTGRSTSRNKTAPDSLLQLARLFFRQPVPACTTFPLFPNPHPPQVNCATLSTVLLKSSIDDQLDRFSDMLVIKVRKTVSHESKSILEFLDTALEKLNVRPDSVSELGNAQAQAARLIEKQPEIQAQITNLEEKHRLLKHTMAGSTTSTAEEDLIKQIHDRFDEFELRLQTFETLAAELREELMSKMEDRERGMNGEIEKFASKWQALRPKIRADCSLAEARDNAKEMEAWQTEWGVLKEQIDGLLADCKDFGLKVPKLASYHAVEGDLNRQQASWALFTEFVEEVDEMANQLWIEFRPKLFSVQDLCIKWETKLREAHEEKDEATGKPKVEFVVVVGRFLFNREF